MFESEKGHRSDLLAALTETLRQPLTAVDDAERIDQIEQLERLKAVAAAIQARVTVDLVESQARVAERAERRAHEAAEAGDFETWRAQRDAARAASVNEAAGERCRARRRRVDIGVQAQVALARRSSPHQGSRSVRTALTLVHDLPHVLSALTLGDLSERRAELVVQETAVLSPEQRQAVDAELADRWGHELGRLGDRELVRRVRAVCYRVDAASVVARAQQAENDRRVSLRPAPDTMTYLTALLPVAQGVAVLAALTRAADTARSAGDVRSKGQVMADLLVERATGQSTAAAVPVEVQVVMTDRALLAGDDTPAHLPGYGTVPAPWARHLVATSGPEGVSPAGVWLRRLYTHPDDGTLVTMDSTRRLFDGALRAYVVARDVTCRTPWCDAPIRHVDHVVDHALGGATSASNGQGLCIRCNLAKAQEGWSALPVDADDGSPPVVLLTTPTGHTYASTAPPLLPGDLGDVGDLGTERVSDGESPLERRWLELLAA